MSAGPSAVVEHALERRVRLRAPVLAGHRGASRRLAEELAREPGCEVVTVRPLTGSILVEREDGALDPVALCARVLDLLSRARDDDGRPLLDGGRADGHAEPPRPTRVARAVVHAFLEINADIRGAMGNRADLGILLPVVFATAGLAEVGVTGKLPAPAWFNLLWWSLRSFMTFNPDAVLEELQRPTTESASARAAAPRDTDTGR